MEMNNRMVYYININYNCIYMIVICQKVVIDFLFQPSPGVNNEFPFFPTLKHFHDKSLEG